MRLDLRVNELIGLNGIWEENIIWRSFSNTDASLILNIPPRTEQRGDRLIWPHSKDGQATVKSVYNRLKD